MTALDTPLQALEHICQRKGCGAMATHQLILAVPRMAGPCECPVLLLLPIVVCPTHQQEAAEVGPEALLETVEVVGRLVGLFKAQIGGDPDMQRAAVQFRELPVAGHA